MRILTQAEAAKKIGMSRSRFREFLFDNQFPFALKLKKSGKDIFIIYDEWVDKWLLSGGKIESF